ncbi:hypothetical protein RBSWK_05919 [Rhodopirellula baltica SWK14]|uniref:Uncharacterized protein n=1 Tax=Rhodopirellula baltica SWK14 TaxID=993516 RepID=L7CAM2_RHOBT|nr:hypothetical protein RBSWK_05919 [Rhodopirellula baltica SWK14]
MNDDDSPSEADRREFVFHPIKNGFRRPTAGASTDEWQRDRVELLLLCQRECVVTGITNRSFARSPPQPDVGYMDNGFEWQIARTG